MTIMKPIKSQRTNIVLFKKQIAGMGTGLFPCRYWNLPHYLFIAAIVLLLAVRYEKTQVVQSHHD